MTDGLHSHYIARCYNNLSHHHADFDIITLSFGAPFPLLDPTCAAIPHGLPLHIHLSDTLFKGRG
jgi:hypothetical protein